MGGEASTTATLCHQPRIGAPGGGTRLTSARASSLWAGCPHPAAHGRSKRSVAGVLVPAAWGNPTCLTRISWVGDGRFRCCWCVGSPCFSRFFQANRLKPGLQATKRRTAVAAQRFGSSRGSVPQTDTTGSGSDRGLAWRSRWNEGSGLGKRNDVRQNRGPALPVRIALKIDGHRLCQHAADAGSARPGDSEDKSRFGLPEACAFELMHTLRRP
jgi:hypothetical protein